VISGRYNMHVAHGRRLAHAIPAQGPSCFEQNGRQPSYEGRQKYVEVLEDFLDAR
jgi:hypothetical protein